MTARVDDRVGANRHGERLLRGVGGARLAFSGQHARHVHLERHVRHRAVARQGADGERASAAGGLEIRVSGTDLRRDSRAGCGADRDRHERRDDRWRSHSFRVHPGRQLQTITCSPSV
jgi:hypothetical protein